MRYRADYDGRMPPAHLTALVTNIGGTNFFGDPHFRLVWSDDRKSPITGLWVDWPAGSAKKPLDRPLRRVFEMRMKPRYGARGVWVLEKWAHPRMYGPRGTWYSPTYLGGTLICQRNNSDEAYKVYASQGEYPSRGEYEYTGFAFTEQELSAHVLATLIRQYTVQDYALPTDPMNRARRLAWLGQQQAEASEIAWEKIARETIDEAMPAFDMNPRLGYGKKHEPYINQVAKRLRIAEHTGVS